MNTRLVVAGIDETGTGVINWESMATENVSGDRAKVTLLWAFGDEVSCDGPNLLGRDTELSLLSNLAAPPAVLWGISELEPGGEIPMHASSTVDFVVVLEGEVTFRLESGASSVLKAGETIIQRGAAHAWRNASRAPCRWMFVALADKS